MKLKSTFIDHHKHDLLILGSPCSENIAKGTTDPRVEFCLSQVKFGRFWAKKPIFGGDGVKLLVPSNRESNETPFSC